MNYIQKIYKEKRDYGECMFDIMKNHCPFNFLDLSENCEYESANDSDCLECWTKERDL
jgi:hypothetical protein